MIHKETRKKTFFYLSATIISCFILIPFFWMILTSFKERGALMTIPIQWLPEKISFRAYQELFSIDFLFKRAIFNSIFVSGMITFITVMSAAMGAYVFAKIDFRGREKLFSLYLATMMIPGQVTMIPNYLVLKYLGLLNSFTGLMLPSIFNAFATFMLRQNMKSIPDAYIEAAELDGASQITIFFRIVLVLSKPVLATLAVITFMGAWNDYLWPLIILTERTKMTLPIGLSLLNGQYSRRYNLLMAGALISLIPILMVYAFAQKYFEQGLSIGGIKG
jgi:multiple sugar transport system permease protein